MKDRFSLGKQWFRSGLYFLALSLVMQCAIADTDCVYDSGNDTYHCSAICNDPDSPDSFQGTWVARFDVFSSIYGLLNQIKFLGFQPTGAASATEVVDANWSFEYEDYAPAGAPTTVASGNADIYNALSSVWQNPRAQSPNRRCQVYLTPHMWDPSDPSIITSGPLAVLVGDSISRSFNESFSDRSSIAHEFSTLPQGVKWMYQVQAEPGMTWGDKYVDVFNKNYAIVPGGNYRDEVRGLASLNAKAFVFELGSNDAIFTLSSSGMANVYSPNTSELLVSIEDITTADTYFTLSSSGMANTYSPDTGKLLLFLEETIAGTYHAKVIESFMNNMSEAYSDVNTSERCVFFVTPSVAPIEMFSASEWYSNEAKWVGATIKLFASTKPNAYVIDWAAASADKHLPDQYDSNGDLIANSNDWFGDADQLHPNAAGQRALRQLIYDALDAHCQ